MPAPQTTRSWRGRSRLPAALKHFWGVTKPPGGAPDDRSPDAQVLADARSASAPRGSIAGEWKREGQGAGRAARHSGGDDREKAQPRDRVTSDLPGWQQRVDATRKEVAAPPPSNEERRCRILSARGPGPARGVVGLDVRLAELFVEHDARELRGVGERGEELPGVGHDDDLGARGSLRDEARERRQEIRMQARLGSLRIMRRPWREQRGRDEEVAQRAVGELGGPERGRSPCCFISSSNPPSLSVTSIAQPGNASATASAYAPESYRPRASRI